MESDIVLRSTITRFIRTITARITSSRTSRIECWLLLSLKVPMIVTEINYSGMLPMKAVNREKEAEKIVGIISSSRSMSISIRLISRVGSRSKVEIVILLAMKESIVFIFDILM